MNKIYSEKVPDKNVKEIKIKEISLRNNLARMYDAQISDYQHKVEINTVVKKLDPQEGEYVLDSGCGTGRITYKLIEAGRRVVGVDFSKESLKVCEQRCNALYNYKNNLYLIRKERLKMLREAKRVLKLNGKLVLTTYNYSLRKIIGRKRETHSNELYSYRYDYFKLKRVVSLVFEGKIEIVGILNLIHWLSPKMLNRFERFLIPIDNFIEKTPFSYMLAHLLSVECKKTKTKEELISDKEMFYNDEK